MIDLLLYNSIIVTVDTERKIWYNGAMAVDNGRVCEVGESEELEHRYGDAKRKIDCEGKIIFPGFAR